MGTWSLNFTSFLGLSHSMSLSLESTIFQTLVPVWTQVHFLGFIRLYNTGNNLDVIEDNSRNAVITYRFPLSPPSWFLSRLVCRHLDCPYVTTLFSLSLSL